MEARTRAATTAAFKRAARSLWRGFGDTRDPVRLMAVHVLQAAGILLLFLLFADVMDLVSPRGDLARWTVAVVVLATLMSLHRAVSRTDSRSAGAWASGAIVVLELSLLAVLFPLLSRLAVAVLPRSVLADLETLLEGDAFSFLILVAFLLFGTRGWGRYMHRNAMARQSEAQANWYRRLAHEDLLTGLRNRRAFEETASRHLGSGSGTAPLTLLMIDVNRFKQVNDTWSHEVGDRALVAVARALEGAVGSAGIVARLAGDEFVVAVPGGKGLGDVVASKVREAGASIAVETGDATSIRVSISVGVAHATAGDTLASLLRRGDLAMYESKRLSRSPA